jgi:hypothetical protein
MGEYFTDAHQRTRVEPSISPIPREPSSIMRTLLDTANHTSQSQGIENRVIWLPGRRNEVLDCCPWLVDKQFEISEPMERVDTA